MSVTESTVASQPELATLLAGGTSFLDVRAPGEACRGSVPGAVNVPLLEDDERHRVGLTYKTEGHDAAVALGHRLVTGDVRRRREAAWRDFARAHPDAWIFCWRGGERSRIAQSWLAELGVRLPRVPGGFKALRHVCLDVLERAPEQKHWLMLGGRTGSGKTDLLTSLENAIDLEGIAAHRGSAFGAREQPQPPPVTFENLLACAFLKHSGPRLVLEDESRTIGRLALPQGWFDRMQAAPVVMLEAPLAQRVANIVREYVTDPLAAGVPPATLHARYTDSLQRIRRRLGGARQQEVVDALNLAFAGGDHAGWVERLLAWYYDPMYDYQAEKKRARVIMQGQQDDVRDFLSR